MNNNMINDDVIRMVQNARRNSCVSERIPVRGEMYVSPSTRKRKKEVERIKKGISCMIASVAVVGTLAAGISVTNTMDFATEVRQEVNDTYTTQNLVGGQYSKQSEHDMAFREYVGDLNDFEVSRLFDETSKEMKADGMIDESKRIEDVVDQMEENYLENSGKSR